MQVNLLDILQLVPFVLGTILTLSVLSRTRINSMSGMFFQNMDGVQDRNTVVQIGGVSIFPLLLIVLSISLGLPKWFGLDDISRIEVEKSGLRIMQVVAGCAMLYVVGLKNDIHGTSSFVKFSVLFLAACIFPVSRLWIDNLQGLFGITDIPGYIGMPLSVILVMYMTETIIILDDLDGLGIGLATIMFVLFLAFGMIYDFTLGSLVSSSALGIALPYFYMKFIRKSWRKTIVGNAGSYVLGYVLSYLMLSYSQQSGVRMPVGMLFVVMGITMIPMLDVMRILRSRMREERALLTPDRNLIQHRLIRIGLPKDAIPVVIVSLFLFFAVINAVWIINFNQVTILVIAEFIVWAFLQMIITYLITINEEQHHRIKWEMSYGREAWESKTPVEVIRRKQRRFGDMGLPEYAILGNETDFIPDGMSIYESILKRILDVILSFILIMAFSPLFILSYLLIKFNDGGPAIYNQERIGRYGRVFRIHKFRSMRIDAEEMGPALSKSGGENDPRLTKVGKFLRAHHLDELPQLWNVFVGDMSFVGYRPERDVFIKEIIEHDPRYTFLYQIRPGVTSYATLYNGYTDTMEKMLRRLNYDLYYLEHGSLWLDMKILFLTFFSIISGKKF